MNPPLRSPEHQAALFKAIHEGVIDTMGSDHAPHTKEEKDQPYGKCVSGVPNMETNLPLLLNAHAQGKLSLDEVVKLTSANTKKLFRYSCHDDLVLVDLNCEKTVDEKTLKTKCAWSPFAGWVLKGWPVYSIIGDSFIDLKSL